MDIQIWVLGGVNAFLITVLLLVGKTISSSLGKKLDAIIKNLNSLNETTAQQAEQIKTLYSSDSYFRSKFDKQEERIRCIEKKIAKYID